MKIKKLIGTNVNGFYVIGVYEKENKKGNKSRKIILECERCGRRLERTDGTDLNTCHCECQKVGFYRKDDPIKIRYKGKDTPFKTFCKENDIDYFKSLHRFQVGWTVDELIQGYFLAECKHCGAYFKTNDTHKMFCSRKCQKRNLKGYEGLTQTNFYACIVCNKIFMSERTDAKCCSDECRRQLARIMRKGRYKHLYEDGTFDPSVTLVNVYHKYNGVCCNCGKELSFESDVVSDEYPSIDHIIPISKGGTHEWDNVQLLCRKCNCIKGAS